MVYNYLLHQLKFMIFWVVKFAHQPIDVRRCVTSDISDEQCDELRRNIVKHWAVNIHLREDLT